MGRTRNGSTPATGSSVTSSRVVTTRSWWMGAARVFPDGGHVPPSESGARAVDPGGGGAALELCVGRSDHGVAGSMAPVRAGPPRGEPQPPTRRKPPGGWQSPARNRGVGPATGSPPWRLRDGGPSRRFPIPCRLLRSPRDATFAGLRGPQWPQSTGSMPPIHPHPREFPFHHPFFASRPSVLRPKHGPAPVSGCRRPA